MVLLLLFSLIMVEIDSLSRKFSAFLNASQRYASLDSSSKQMVLVQDLPNTIGASVLVTRTRQLFQTSLKEFLVSMRVKHPVVLVVTESEMRSDEDFGYSTTYREGLTVKGLLGDDILLHPGTTHITFNPIAKTIMVRALQPMPAFKQLPKTLLQAIAEMSAGDIRSALNCATLVAMQLRNAPKRKADASMYFFQTI
jgi:cell cycle checkpoint protein